jgi:glucose/arabinose dehydrogenase
MSQGIGRPRGGVEAWAGGHELGASSGFETDRAAVLSFDPNGKDRKLFATGIRNCVGLAIQPETGMPWCSTNERDGLGDDLWLAMVQYR